MPVPSQLRVSSAQREEFVQTRAHARQPYLRERAAVLLKMASGHSLQEAARSGGWKPHHPDTIGTGVHRQEPAGLDGRRIHAGGGRQRAFFPCAE